MCIRTKTVHHLLKIAVLLFSAAIANARLGENEKDLTKRFGDLHKWKANDQLILLYHSDRLYHLIPTRVFATISPPESQ